MYNKGKIILKNEHEEEKEYAILVTFDITEKNKSYVLYTDYSKDDENNLKIFSAIYDKNWNLEPVTEKDEIEIIEKYIKDLEKDFRDGIKLTS